MRANSVRETPTKSPGAPSVVRILLFAAALIGFWFGWHAFWFLTDDAYIAFRYVSNSQLGFGYVWNPPPFQPVEGYTSFLWIVLLDWVWTLTGIEPPVSSNPIAFVFGVGTVGLTARLALALPLAARLESLRTPIFAVVLIGLIANANFLIWTSSGLETSLFNFLLVSWVTACLVQTPFSRAQVFCVSLTAGLLCLARPDGLLFAAATGALLYYGFGPMPGRRSALHRPLTPLLHAWPLALPLAHLIWRRAFYSEWLPNTYYAKQVSAWPESGLRYLAAYLLEYGLWFFALLAVVFGVVWLSDAAKRVRVSGLSWPDGRTAIGLCVLASIGAHAAYYTFSVGGDHFEYRVYSHSVPLVVLASVWIANALTTRWHLPVSTALLLPMVVVSLSIPLPWLVWARSGEFSTRRETSNLRIPLAPELPASLAWYGSAFDRLQDWLILEHAVGKRHREHQVFHDYQIARYPQQRLLDSTEGPNAPLIYKEVAVGVPGWILARVSIIDLMGLSDRVIARNPQLRAKQRRMGHDRRPPKGYVECLRPNLQVRFDKEPDRAMPKPGRVVVLERRAALDDDAILACEQAYREQ